MQPASICFPLGYILVQFCFPERSGCSTHRMLLKTQSKYSCSVRSQQSAPRHLRRQLTDQAVLHALHIADRSCSHAAPLQHQGSFLSPLSLCLFWLVIQSISNISGRSGPCRNCLAGKSTMISPRRSAYWVCMHALHAHSMYKDSLLP